MSWTNWFKKPTLSPCSYFHCDHDYQSWTPWKLGRQHGSHYPVQYQYQYPISICCECGRKKVEHERMVTRWVAPEDEGYVPFIVRM